MTIEEASVNISNPDPIVAIKAAIVCTNTKDTYSAGFRNGLRYAVAILTDEEPKYEEVLPLRCRGCSQYVGGYCQEHDTAVRPDDYCSFGAWTPEEE